ncbi:MAG: RHS repeat-associated core domain-containing protein [Cellulomonas sp.]|nr:RHS repeat-associated core domain-containing protein [Cellulomonas sp.]
MRRSATRCNPWSGVNLVERYFDAVKGVAACKNGLNTVTFVRRSSEMFRDGTGNMWGEGSEELLSPGQSFTFSGEIVWRKNGTIPTPSAAVVLPDAQIAGEPSACMSNSASMLREDPVNTATGHLVESATDVQVGSASMPLRLRRSYDSGRTATSAFGPSWTYEFGAFLTRDAATGRAVVDTGAGNLVGFTKQPDGSYLSDPAVTSELSETADGYRLRMDCSGVSMTFDASGGLTGIVGDDSGYELSLTRDAAGRLATLTNTDGQTLTFTHSADLLTQVRLADGRHVDYAYTGGRLTSVTTLDGSVVTYAYDSQGHLTAKSAGDRTITTAYDPATGRVVSQTDGVGATTTFAWDEATQTATTTFPGGGIATDVYAGNLLARTSDATGNLTQYEYDSDGQISAVIDPLGRYTTLRHDARGLLLERIGPAPQAYREAWTYDDAGRVLTETDRNNEVTTYTYNPDGLVEKVTDPLGRVTSYTYVNGRVASVTEPRGNLSGAVRSDFTTTYTYDTRGHPHSATDPLGRTVTTVHDDAGNLVSATDAAGATTTFTYDESGRRLTVTEPRGNVTGADPALYTSTNTYDDLGQLTSVTDPAGNVVRYRYDAQGRLTSATAPGNRVTTYEHDLDGNVTGVTDPEGARTTYTYDVAGRRTSMTTPRGNALPAGSDRTPYTWKYTYDGAGQLLTEENPTTGRTTSTYDTYGRTTVRTGPTGISTAWTYDGTGNTLTQTTNLPTVDGEFTAPGVTTTHQYDAAGQLSATIDPRGALSGADPEQYATTYAYDAAGHLLKETDPLGGARTYTYDRAGQLVKVVEPRGNVTGANPATYATSFGYDAAGRQNRITTPSGAITTQAFDLSGHLVSTTDPRGNVTGVSPQQFTTTYTVDRLGRVTDVVEPGGAATHLEYDAAGNIASRKNANNRVTSYTYDKAGRLLTKSSPVGQVWETTYDADGNVASLTTPIGTATAAVGDGTITYANDPAGRLTTIDYSDATPDVTYTRALDGFVTAAATTAGAKQTFGRTPGGQLSSVYSDGQAAGTADSNTIGYRYDAAGFLIGRDAKQHSTAYTYDRAGRLASAGAGTAVVKLGYDAAGNTTTLTPPTGNGYVETRTWDPDGRLSAVTSKRGTAVLSSFTQTFDRASNPATLTMVSGGTTTRTANTYDAAGRLTKTCYAASCTNATAYLEYAYDPVGNRLSDKRVGVTNPATTTYAYDAADRLLTTKVGTTTTSYTHDLNGNRTAAGARTFTYDLANRVITTTLSGTTTTYRYDPSGNRASQTVGTTTTHFAWDLLAGVPQLAQETDNAGAPLRSYTHTPDGDPLTLTTPQATSYYHHDQLGGVANVTSGTGATQHTYTYEPFGAQRTATSASGAPVNPLRFTGESLDGTGLYNLRARLYDPTRGQFTALDPLVETTAQPYAYARNNPLRYIDPTGTIDCEVYSDACVAGSALKGLGLGVLDTVKTIFYPWDAINEHLRVCTAGMYNGQQAEADLLCLDGMNPIAGIRDGFTAAWSSAERGCYEDFGRQFAAPVIGTALTVAPFAKGTSRAPSGSRAGGGGSGATTQRAESVLAPVAIGPGARLLDDAARIETHLARLDHSPANDAMLARIRAAAAAGRPLSAADQSFMRHELTEAGLMDRGMGYEEAHGLAGQTHPTFGNYDPEVIKQFPELFNQNWRNYWGIE